MIHKTFKLLGAYLGVILLTSFLVCCKKQAPEVIVKDFPAEYALHGEGIDSLNRYAGMYMIAVAGDKFVCMRNSAKFFLVFDSDFHLQKEFLAKGHGHNEFQSPRYCGQYIKEGDKESIFVLERDQQKLFKIPLSGAEDFECVVDMHQHTDLMPSYLFRLSDTVCIGANNLEDNPFFVLNTRNWKAQTFDTAYPFEGNEADVFAQSQNTGTYSPAKSRVAITYFNLPQMDIRSAEGRLLRTIFYKNKVLPSELDSEDLKDYFGWVTSTDNYIYAKYDGDEQKAAEGKTWILVFDWEGAPVCRMEIDASVNFTVDEKNGRLISLNEDDTEFVASAYVLPDILTKNLSLL